jgi:hypothetical protein
MWSALSNSEERSYLEVQTDMYEYSPSKKTPPFLGPIRCYWIFLLYWYPSCPPFYGWTVSLI